MLAAHLT